MYKKVLCVVLAISLVLPTFFSLSAYAEPAASDDTSAETMTETTSGTQNADEVYSYLRYFDAQENKEKPIAKIVAYSGDPVELSEGNTYNYEVEVQTPGLYALAINYQCKPGRTTNPSLQVAINGTVPYSEARTVELTRLWKDKERGRRDSSGNEIVPDQEEVFEYRNVTIQDNSGYYGDTLYFALNAGKNILTLTMTAETIEVTEIAFQNEESAPSYDEVAGSFTYPNYTGEPLYYEAELSTLKSDTTIYAANDSTSPAVSPYDPKVKNLNVMGGEQWSSAGQYIEWTVDVPEDGLYQIAFKARQNFNVGVSSFRTVRIDGKTTYSGLETIAFPYSSKFQNVVLGEDGEPYLFELSKGEHTIQMEVILGEFSNVLPYIDEVINALNTAYRNIIMVTTSSPDSYRDYRLGENLPEVIQSLDEQRQILEEMDAYIAETMTNASSASQVIGTLAEQLADFVEDPYRITSRLTNFKSNVTELSTWLADAKSQPLQIDYFVLYAPGGEIKSTKAGFWDTLKHEWVMFFNTFSDDYLGIVEGENTITVWINGGQVGMNNVKELIDSEYNPTHDTHVNIKLVTASLLLAIVAGKAPDVSIGITGEELMNYVFRGALCDLSQCEGFDEVTKRFFPSALTQIEYEGHYYGLPTSQTFDMLFYRTDIFDELGIEPPTTWDEVVSVMAALKKKNLEFGLPLTMYSTFLYQYGGTMYNEERTATTLQSLEAITAFTDYCSFFTDYKVPLSFDAVNRFRTGEMPVLVQPYNFLCTLALSAPEIDGQWAMAPIPGYVREDGTIDRTDMLTTSYVVATNEDKLDESWEFIDWYLSDDIQSRLAQKGEMILGISSRSTTANVNAFYGLDWTKEQLATLQEQAKTLNALPAVPGSYYTTRHLNNAINNVLYSSGIPGEELISFSQIIDKEIERKRDELGMNQ